MTKEQKVEAATLHSAMALAFAEIEAATKGADNPFFKSKYADLPAIIAAVKPALTAHGLFFTQHCHPSETGVIVETVLHHANGEQLSMGSLYVPANKKDPQGFGSAQTYARRYALQTAFGVPVEDDDGNAATKAVNIAKNEPTSDPTPPKRSKGIAPPQKPGDPSATDVKTMIRTMHHEVLGCGDDDQLDLYLDTKEAKEAIDQCKRRAPHWWEYTEDTPPDFTPMMIVIENQRKSFKQPATVMDAG